MTEQDSLALATFHGRAEDAVADGLSAARALLEAVVGDRGIAEDSRHIMPTAAPDTHSALVQ